MYVSGKHGKIRFFVYQYALVPSLIQMTCSFMSSIVIACVGYIKMTHEFPKVSQRGLNQQVKMVLHEDITIDSDVVDFA